MLLVGHHSSPLTSARPPAGLEGTQHAPLCTLQCPQIRPSSPSRPRFSIPSRVRNYFIMIKAAKLSSSNCQTAFGQFGQRSVRFQRSVSAGRPERSRCVSPVAGAMALANNPCSRVRSRQGAAAAEGRRATLRCEGRRPTERVGLVLFLPESGVVSSHTHSCAFLCILVHFIVFIKQ